MKKKIDRLERIATEIGFILKGEKKIYIKERKKKKSQFPRFLLLLQRACSRHCREQRRISNRENIKAKKKKKSNGG